MLHNYTRVANIHILFNELNIENDMYCHFGRSLSGCLVQTGIWDRILFVFKIHPYLRVITHKIII